MTDEDSGVLWTSRILRCIPTHREPRMTLAQIAARASEDLPLTGADALAATQTVITLLRVFGVLDEGADDMRAGGQMPAYFLRSLEWYVRHQAAMLDGWREPISAAEATNGPALLMGIEQRRLHLAQSLGIAATPAREQPAVLVLVKAIIRRRPHFLFQWDARAGQMQLIGGRIEPGELPAQAALRELQEEVGDHQSPRWQPARDYAIAPLPLKAGPLALMQISPSYGALTAYTFHVFAARIHAACITLHAGDGWLDRQDMLRGKTRAGLSLGNPALYRLLIDNVAGGLKRVPASFFLQVHEQLVGVGERAGEHRDHP
jgi:hypothetical protein